MKAINTRYKGRLFRSRLEARWAVFFDALGVKWEYEKEGYALSNGSYYLPDFWLPDLQSWFEVKGEYPTEVERTKAELLAAESVHKVYIAYGPIEAQLEHDPWIDSMFCYWPQSDTEGHVWAWEDLPYYWYHCDKCGKTGIVWSGKVERLCSCSYEFKQHSTVVDRAFEASLSARFEHGESGATTWAHT